MSSATEATGSRATGATDGAPGPGIVVVDAGLVPPPSTSSRSHRRGGDGV